MGGRRSREYARRAADPELLEWVRSLPKVELCAHLCGTVRDSTIKELAAGVRLEGKEVDLDQLVSVTEQAAPSLGECFALFELVHTLTTTHEAMTRLTREAMEDFRADGVMYLELRTTPKHKPDLRMSKESYVEAVLRGIDEYYAASPHPPEDDIVVRLLLSINRERSLEDAMETVALAAALCADGSSVVGVALTGNPMAGEWEELRPALKMAQRLGLKVVLEAGEGYNQVELRQMIEFGPDRLTHACCLDPALQQMLLESRIPLEVCLTSNLVTRAVPDYARHHFGPLFKLGHPLAICTDDSTILNTSMSQELAIAAQAFGLSRRQVRQLALSAVDHAFLPEEERAELKRRMRAKMGMQDSACEEAVQAAAAAAIGVVSKAAAGGRPAPAAAPAAANGRPAAPAAAPAAAAPAAAAPAADGKAAEPRSRWRLRWPMKGLRVASS